MGENRIMQDLYEENQKLKARVAELEAQHFSECAQIAHYSDELKATEEVARRTADYGKATPAQFLDLLDENAKLKELLRKAVEDINYYVDCYEAHCDECCCDQDNHCHWKHEAKALKLIGEDGETE